MAFGVKFTGQLDAVIVMDIPQSSRCRLRPSKDAYAGFLASLGTTIYKTIVM